MTVLWCIYGYSLAFTEGNSVIGGFSRLFLRGTFDPVTQNFSLASTFSRNTPLYELLVGLRVAEEEEREGLDITSHGERAYDL